MTRPRGFLNHESIVQKKPQWVSRTLNSGHLKGACRSCQVQSQMTQDLCQLSSHQRMSITYISNSLESAFGDTILAPSVLGYVKHTSTCAHVQMSPAQRILGGGVQTSGWFFYQGALDNHSVCTDCIFPHGRWGYNHLCLPWLGTGC